jgi:hypothetical protein
MRHPSGAAPRCAKSRNRVSEIPQANDCAELEPPFCGQNADGFGWPVRHDPCSNTADMHLSAYLRSSTALVLIGLVLGSTTLALCPFEGSHARCAAQMPQPLASPGSCHESQAPAGDPSCCWSTATPPTSTPATSIVAASPLNALVSIAGAVPPTIEGLNQVVQSAPLETRTRPLFVLHSAFLI